MGKLKASVSRKEARKAHKLAAKEKKQQRHASRPIQQTAGSAKTQPKPSVLPPGAKGDNAEGRRRGTDEGHGKSRSGTAKKGMVQGGVGKRGGSTGGGGGGNGRRKRWKPEEMDPMIAAEDAEMKRLERLLGVSGPNASKKRAKLSRELEMEDGLGDDFGAFLTDLDRISEAVGGKENGSSEDSLAHEADWDFHRDVSEVSSESEGGGRRGTSEQAVVGDEPNRRQVRWKDEEGLDDGAESSEGDAECDKWGLNMEEGREQGENADFDGRAVSLHSDKAGRMDGAVGGSEESEEEEDDDDSSVMQEGGGMEVTRRGGGQENSEDDLSFEEGDRQRQLNVANASSDPSSKSDGEESESEQERGVDGSDGSDASDSVAKDGQTGVDKESEDFLRHVYRPTPGQDIYGRKVGGVSGGAVPAKYIPPHLRAAAAAVAAEAEVGEVEEEGGTSSTSGRGSAGIGGGRNRKVQRVINGIMNRLSEETMEPVTARLKDAYRGNSTTEVNEALWQSTRAVCVHEKHVMTTLIPSFAAVIAALNISLGADVGGFFLEIIAKELNAEILAAPSRPTIRHGAGGRGGRGTGSNLLLLLAYLYNYGVAHCSLIYDLIGLLVDAFGENEMELLLLLLRHSGFQLRSDDSQALKEKIALVKEKATAATSDNNDSMNILTPGSTVSTDGPASSVLEEEKGRWKTAFGVAALGKSSEDASATGDVNGLGDASPGVAVTSGSRARYLLDTILELQSKKRNRLQEQGQEAGRRVRKWLGSVKAAKGGIGVARSGASRGGGGDASLRVSWAELVSTESKGRWWRVGAAWAGRTAEDRDGEKMGTGGEVRGTKHVNRGSTGGGGDMGHGATGVADGKGGNATNGLTGDEEEKVELMKLAARQRMNTDVRRSVFVSIVGSSDCEDALEKILRLNLKGAQEREIARVIVECCCQEGSYNPFYAHLAERVCDRQPKLRFTFQIAFWDALKTLDEGAARRAGSLARLMAHLVVRKQMSLTVLKAVDVPELSPSGLLLVRMFFHEIISAGDDGSFMEVFRRLARPPGAKDVGGHSAARDNTLVFLRGHLGPPPRTWDRERQKVFRKRVKGACRLIDAMVTAEELG